MLKIFAFFLILVSILSFRIQTDIQEKPALQNINWPFTICGQGKWTIESLILAIAPARNTNNDMDISGTATDSVSFKSMTLSVKLNGVFLHSEEIKFQAEFDEGDTVEFRYKSFIPSYIPSGNYMMTFQFHNTDGGDEGCLNMSFKI